MLIKLTFSKTGGKMFLTFINKYDLDVVADSKDCYFKACSDYYIGYNKYTGEFFGRISIEKFNEILKEEENDYRKI